MLGTTVKVSLPLTAMSAMLFVDSVKLLALVPESSTVSAPVAPVPVLLTVMVLAD